MNQGLFTTESLIGSFEVVVRTGPRLSPREAEAVARLLSAAYRKGEVHADRSRESPIDDSPGSYMGILSEPGREVAAIREHGALVGVLVTAAPPAGPYVPLRKLSYMAFWSPPGRPGLKRRVLKAALQAFQAAGLSIVGTEDTGADGQQGLLAQAGMRMVRDHAEICWLLSNLLGRTVTRIESQRDLSQLSYVAEVRGRKLEVARALYCADAFQGSCYQQHKAMVERQMRLQHGHDDLVRFYRLAQSWREDGLYFLLGFSGTVVLGPDDGVSDFWVSRGLAIGPQVSLNDILGPDRSTIYLPARKPEDLIEAASLQVLRPGFCDFLLWALRMVAPVMLVTSAPRLQVIPVLDRPVSELSPVRLFDLIEALALTDLFPAKEDKMTTPDGIDRIAWRTPPPGRLELEADLYAQQSRLAAETLQLLRPAEKAPLVFMGSGPNDIPAAERLALLARGGAPVLFISFGRVLEEHLNQMLRELAPGHAPVLSFRASSFYEAMVILEALGLSPAPLMEG